MNKTKQPNTEEKELAENSLRDLFKNFGLREPEIISSIEELRELMNIENDLISSFSKVVLQNSFFINKEIKIERKNISTYLQQILKRRLNYNTHFKIIKDKHQETKSISSAWKKGTFTAEKISSLAFLDYTEGIFKKNTTSAEELFKDLKTLESNLSINLEELKETILDANISKLEQAITRLINLGENYNALEGLKATDFNLPENYNTLETIKKVIKKEYEINNLASKKIDFFNIVNPREIAKDLKAPYSVILDIFN